MGNNSSHRYHKPYLLESCSPTSLLQRKCLDVSSFTKKVLLDMSIAMPTTVFFCFYPYFIEFSCHTLGGPRSIAKLVYHSNKYGLWYLWLWLYLPGWWFEPLWKIWVRQLGWWHSQYMGKFQKWQPFTTNQLLVGLTYTPTYNWDHIIDLIRKNHHRWGGLSFTPTHYIPITCTSNRPIHDELHHPCISICGYERGLWLRVQVVKQPFRFPRTCPMTAAPAFLEPW